MATQPTQQTRRFDELMRRDMEAIGLRTSFALPPGPSSTRRRVPAS
jgi:hypothetical protein